MVDMEWPKPIETQEWEKPHFRGMKPIGIFPLRDVAYFEGRTFLAEPREYCSHSEPAGVDSDGDPLVLIPRVLFAGHQWADGSRDVTWLCLDCILEQFVPSAGASRDE